MRIKSDLATRSKWIWPLAIVFVILYAVHLDLTDTHTTQHRADITFMGKHFVTNLTCPEVGSMMSVGKWKSRTLTKTEEKELDSFYVKARAKLPKSLERSDKKCGNVNYLGSYLRAICNPKGSTPCCYNNKCIKKSVVDCMCQGCYDLRSQIHAEYSTFIPDDDSCQVKYFNGITSCDVLKEGRIVFVGDSLMRQFFTGLLVLMAEDDVNKIHEPDLNKDLRRQCSGLNLFGLKQCRYAFRRTTQMCKGKVTASLMECRRISVAAEFHDDVKRDAAANRRTTYVISVGAHDQFHGDKIFEGFILKAIKLLINKTWPKLIWVTTHRMGPMKSFSQPRQLNPNVEKYNAYMKTAMARYNIPVLDVYNLTRNVVSMDGMHYGAGVNILKAQLLLSFINDLQW